MGGSVGGNFGNTQGVSKLSLEQISDLLTLLSLVPGVDTFADLAAVFVDLERGDITSAALDAFGAVPLIGEIADISKTAKYLNKASDALKVANKATDVGNVIKKISPSRLVQTHKLTLSKKQYTNLLENIRKNGITEPIKYVVYKGKKYVVDGHHRLRAAKQLKLDKVPIKEVSLPYKGYKTVKDLLWYE